MVAITSWLPLAAGGVALGLAFTLSPLTVLVVAAVALLVRHAASRLPTDERWWFTRLFGVAFAARVLAIAGLFLLSDHDSQASGYLFGDEMYSLSRSWRLRNVLLGIPQLKYDYVTAFEGYGQSSYIDAMAYLQVLVGPAPYGLRVLNAALFLGAVILLFFTVRRSFGSVPAFAGTVALLFLPTLFFWSISLLKESVYFVLTVAAFVAVIQTLRARSWHMRLVWAVGFAAALVGLSDLRSGAVALVVGGISLGLLGGYVTSRRGGVAIAGLAMVALVAALLFAPPLQQRLMASINHAATVHSGHVFTVGHGYKLLDEAYYVRPGTPQYDLLPSEAARYVIRGVVAYLTVPLPWQIASLREVSYLPEHMFWYALLGLAVVGIGSAVKRDRLVAMLLLGYVLPTAAAVAVTTGNVGTLIRHRTLIVPFLVWISALGLLAILHRIHEAHRA